MTDTATLSADERDQVIEAVIATQALAGVAVSWDDVDLWLTLAEREPLPDLLASPVSN